ncbi:MAG: CHAD domain-containing protein [Chloroflexota bacterium]
MSYKLPTNQKLPPGIKRIACEQIDDALASLRSSDEELDEIVHESRKRLKKLRGLLRLVRKEIGETVYQRENIAFRDAGRLLGGLRDSAVRIETLADLLAEPALAPADDAFSTLKRAVNTIYDDMRQQVITEEQALEKVTARIEAARTRVGEWPLEDDSFAAVAGGLRKVYKRGQNRAADAAEEATMAAFHEWRKRVKYLWYNVRILKPIWPEPMAVLADEIHDLSDLLGEEHDLAGLRDFIRSQPALISDEENAAALLSLIDEKRILLQKQSLRQGRFIYAESPDDFVARIEAYWEAAQLIVLPPRTRHMRQARRRRPLFNADADLFAVPGGRLFRRMPEERYNE